LKPSVKDRYSVFLLFGGEKGAHHSVVTVKSFKYPFMGEDDLQIGMISTENEFRRRGLAAYTINEILKRYEKPGRTIWYVTHEDNVASRNLAEKVGFSEYSKAIRKGTFLLGIYEAVAQEGKMPLSPERIPDYSLITELPGLRAPQEQVARLYQRYHFAKDLAADKDVLEIGCGAGLGLGYLAKAAKTVVGGDIDPKNVSLAREYYKDRQSITVDSMDAHNLSSPDKAFDLVLLYETIYYLKDPSRCIAEARRVLRGNGILIVCTVNKDWEDFHPSPYTYKYFSVPELYELMKKSFREVKVCGGFPIVKGGARSKVTSLVKMSAVKLNLIPGTLEGRTYLKRIFMGKLVPLPAEITENIAPYGPPIEIPADKVNRDFKILYAMGKK
jgi:SAM-dependent methyltransferase